MTSFFSIFLTLLVRNILEINRYLNFRRIDQLHYLCWTLQLLIYFKSRNIIIKLTLIKDWLCLRFFEFLLLCPRDVALNDKACLFEIELASRLMLSNEWAWTYYRLQLQISLVSFSTCFLLSLSQAILSFVVVNLLILLLALFALIKWLISNFLNLHILRTKEIACNFFRFQRVFIIRGQRRQT